MQQYTLTQSNFGSGELDQACRGSLGGTAYQTGLSKAVNVFFNPTGSVFKRGGTRHVGVGLSSYSVHKIVTLKKPDQRYLVVFVPSLILVYSTAYEYVVSLSSPYTADDIPSLSAKESLGKLYIVHRNYAPAILDGPDEGNTDVSAVDSGSTVSIDDLSLFAGDEDVSIDDCAISMDWSLTYPTFSGDVTFGSADNYPGVQAFKGGRWLLGSTSNKPNTLWASRPFDSDGNSRYTDFMLADKYTTTTTYTNVKTTLDSDGSTVSDIDSESAVDEPYVDGDTEYTSDKTTTTKSTTDENSNAITVITTTYKVVKFTYDVLSSHAIELTESEMTGGSIRWITNQSRLLVGYGRSIWMDSGDALTPTDFDLTKTLSMGNSDVEPVSYGSLIMFAGMNSRSVIAISYNSDSGGFVSADISVNARSMLYSGVAKLAIVEDRIPVLFVLCNDGSLLACTLNTEAGLFGWSEIEFEDDTEVIGINTFQDDEKDELYMVVKRGGTIGVERLGIHTLEDSSDTPFVDNATEYADSDGSLTFTIPSGIYEAGKTVRVVADGVYVRDAVIAGSGDTDITLEIAAKKLIVGCPYEARIRTLNQQLVANGSSVGKSRQALSPQKALMYYSGEFKAGFADDGNDVRLARYGESNYGEGDALVSGYMDIRGSSGTKEQVEETFVSDKPYPWCLLSVTTRYEIKEI